MFSRVFLAQTSREMEQFHPQKLAYMACHFSPYGAGLSNMPQALPENSILLLDDSMPVQEHDPKLVTEQLQALIKQFSVQAVLLDFQGEKSQGCTDMASAILQALDCPVAVTEQYAKEFSCPVFLAPPPVNIALPDYLAPWQDRSIYLEIAPQAMEFTVTEKGCTSAPVYTVGSLPLQDKRLHCQYNVKVHKDKAVFTLQRAKEDLSALVKECYELGVRGAVGLYQELRNI